MELKLKKLKVAFFFDAGVERHGNFDIGTGCKLIRGYQ